MMKGSDPSLPISKTLVSMNAMVLIAGQAVFDYALITKHCSFQLGIGNAEETRGENACKF